MSKLTESILQSILEELQSIRKHVVPTPPPNPVELERDITVALGIGPEEFGNR